MPEQAGAGMSLSDKEIIILLLKDNPMRQDQVSAGLLLTKNALKSIDKIEVMKNGRIS
jgi:hypothetical protein